MGAARHPDPDRGVVARPRQPRRRHRPRCADKPRLPHETDELPPANAVLVAPATFNTVNQWAAGINDTLPLGLLNELLGLEVPIVVAMYCKAALAAHPAYRPNIRRLQQAGATVLEGEHSITVSHDGFSWTTIRDALGALPRERPSRHRTVPG